MDAFCATYERLPALYASDPQIFMGGFMPEGLMAQSITADPRNVSVKVLNWMQWGTVG